MLERTASSLRQDESPGSDSVLTAGWSLAVAAWLGAAVWVAAHPPALSSDDAFFLVRALTRFSVLDFSPQFPGYPGFVAMGRGLAMFVTPVAALAILTGAIALSLPPMVALIVRRNSRAPWAPLVGFALTLAGPLMPDLALSLLTDGAGIFFLLVFIALLPHAGVAVATPSALIAGAALGWAIACRPSDAALFAGAFAGAVWSVPRLWWPIVLGTAVVLAPVAAILFALEGPLYVGEGFRFLSGHALLWGNTPFAVAGQDETWLAAILAVPLGGLVAVVAIAGVAGALVRPGGRSPALTAAIGAFFAHAAWIVFLQNPDHLRHLAPLAVLGGLIVVLSWPPVPRLGFVVVATALLFAANVASLALSVRPSPGALPPLAAAESFLAGEPPGTALATNDGVFLLRTALSGVRVYDMHYPADAALGMSTATGLAFRLTATPFAGHVATTAFPTRFAGERTLFLYASPAGHL